MKIRLIYSLLLILPTVFAGETEYKEPTQAELQAAFEKDIRKRAGENPELAKILQEHDEKNNPELVKEKLEAQAATEAQSKARDFTPSSEIADEAFRKGDYETALKHYEALGEDGDSDASLTAGLIHAEGAEGIDADKAKASAWFKRSSDQGGKAGTDLYEEMDNKNELSVEDRAKAENLIHEFRENDSKLSNGQITSIDRSYSSDISLSVSGIGSQQHYSKSELMHISNANSYTAPTDTEASFSPMRSSSGDYSYRPEKVLSSHYLPERE